MVPGRTNQTQDIERLHNGHSGFTTENHIPPSGLGPCIVVIACVEWLLASVLLNWMGVMNTKAHVIDAHVNPICALKHTCMHALLLPLLNFLSSLVFTAILTMSVIACF